MKSTAGRIANGSFRLVWTKDDGTTGSMALDDDRAARMIALIESGEDFESARQKSKTANA